MPGPAGMTDKRLSFESPRHPSLEPESRFFIRRYEAGPRIKSGVT